MPISKYGYWFPTSSIREHHTLPGKMKPDYQLRSWLRKMKEKLKEFSLSDAQMLILTPDFGFGAKELVYFALNSAPLSTTFVYLDRWPPIVCNDSASHFNLLNLSVSSKGDSRTHSSTMGAIGRCFAKAREAAKSLAASVLSSFVMLSSGFSAGATQMAYPLARQLAVPVAVAVLTTSCSGWEEIIDSEENTSATKPNDSSEQYIHWLNSLNTAHLQVGQETNLLKWITLSDGVELIKTEIASEWGRSEVIDPEHYTPTRSWLCCFVFHVQKWQETKETWTNPLMIKAKEYKEVWFEEWNVINDFNPNLNCLRPESKEYVYRSHVVPWFVAKELYADPNIELIITERWSDPDIENVSFPIDPTQHADWQVEKIKNYTPYANIKYCPWSWSDVRNYVEKHPNKKFIISCASDELNRPYRNNIDYLKTDEYEWYNNERTAKEKFMSLKKKVYMNLKRLLDQDNCASIIAICNKWSPVERDTSREDAMKTLNENSPPEEWWLYNSASFNSTKKNKFTATWYNTTNPQEARYSNTKVYGDRSASRVPVWFTEGINNRIIPQHAWIYKAARGEWLDAYNISTSSPAAATGAAGIYSRVSILTGVNPKLSVVDASSIYIDYLSPETYKVKQKDESVVDGGYRYKLKRWQEMLYNEAMAKKNIDTLALNSNDVPLPNFKWCCYMWKGIQFEYKGVRYDAIDDNKSIVLEAIESWDACWYWNEEKHLEQWWDKNQANFDVYIIIKGKKYGELKYSVTKPISTGSSSINPVTM